MGGTFSDITEDGNVWQDERLSVPPCAEAGDLGWAFAESKPSFVVAPMASANKPRVPVKHSSDFSSEASTRDASPDSSRSSNDLAGQSAPTEDSSHQSPSQWVLQPGAGDGKDCPGRWRSAIWKPLHQCKALEGCCLLSESRLEQIWPHLPLRTRFASRWRLIYSPRVHGVSLGTFFRQCQAWPGESLLLMEDTEGSVFGGFASHTWRASSTQQHCGSPECFVFSFGSPTPRRIKMTAGEQHLRLGLACSGQAPERLTVYRVHEGTWAYEQGVEVGDELVEVAGEPVSTMTPEHLEGYMRTKRPLELTFARMDTMAVYPWAGRNQHFMFSSWNGLSMGGGDNVAFWVGKDFLTGTSGTSATFGNPRPLSSSSEFVLCNFECWAFDNSAWLDEPSDAFGLLQDDSPSHDQELAAAYDGIRSGRAPCTARTSTRQQDLRNTATSSLRFSTML